jgi:hypothetical protein
VIFRKPIKKTIALAQIPNPHWVSLAWRFLIDNSQTDRGEQNKFSHGRCSTHKQAGHANQGGRLFRPFTHVPYHAIASQVTCTVWYQCTGTGTRDLGTTRFRSDRNKRAKTRTALENRVETTQNVFISFF